MPMVGNGGMRIKKFLRFILLRDRSLMMKLTVYSAMLVVIPMSLAGYISYAQSSRALESEARQYSWQIIEQVKHYVEDYIRDYELITLKIVNHPDTVAFLKLKTLQEVLDTDLVPKVRNVLKNFAYSQSDVTNITLVLDDFLSIQSAVTQDSYRVESIEEEAWYDHVPVTGPPQVYSRFITWNGRPEPVLSIVKRIVNPQTLGAYGMLVIDLNYKRLHETARGIRLGESGQGYLFIADERGRIVYHPDTELIGTEVDLAVSRPIRDTVSGSFTAGDGANKMLYTHSRSDSMDWHFITVIPYDELMTARTQMGQTILAATAAFTVLAFILSLGLASSIVRPIKRLYLYMRKVEKGDFNEHVTVESNDEIGMLGAGFNKMVARLSELLDEVYFSKLKATEMHLRQKESELKMLQAQMNPHFLYNALETIRGMALESDMMEIASISASLARILRYNVKHSDICVTVRQEMEIVDVYLKIQQYRFDERLMYDILLPEWALRQNIVKLALQPLVENCIVHGLEQHGGTTHIRVEAEKLSNHLFALYVRDDGPGIADDRLRLLRRQMEEAREESHIGLMNVHRRIRHIFGESYGISLESEECKGTVVKVILPYMSCERERIDVG
jgi:two-component system sensor histidine kinase YesM